MAGSAVQARPACRRPLIRAWPEPVLLAVGPVPRLAASRAGMTRKPYGRPHGTCFFRLGMRHALPVLQPPWMRPSPTPPHPHPTPDPLPPGTARKRLRAATENEPFAPRAVGRRTCCRLIVQSEPSVVRRDAYRNRPVQPAKREQPLPHRIPLRCASGPCAARQAPMASRCTAVRARSARSARVQPFQRAAARSHAARKRLPCSSARGERLLPSRLC